MYPRQRERTKKIFGLLQSDENTQKHSGINSPAPNNRRPSRPRPYDDDHQLSQRKKVSNIARSQSSNIKNPVQSTIKKSPVKQSHSSKKCDKSSGNAELHDNYSAPNYRRPLRPRPYDNDRHLSQCKKVLKTARSQSPNIQNPVQSMCRPTVKSIKMSPAKQGRSSKKIVKSSSNAEVHDAVGLDFDDDDSVCDKTYDPMIAGDFSSSDDSENELLRKVKKVKKQLFTPMKKESKKKNIQHDSLITVQAIIESDRTPKRRPISDNQTKTLHNLQTNTSLITPEDLGFVQHVYPKNHNIDDDILIFDEELNNPQKEVDKSNLDQPKDLILTRSLSSLACLALQSVDAAIKSTVDLSSIEKDPLDNLSGDFPDNDDTQINKDHNIGNVNLIQTNENNYFSPQINRTRSIEHSSTKKNPPKRFLTSTVDLSLIEPDPIDNLSGDCPDNYVTQINTEQNIDNIILIQHNENDNFSPQMNRTRPIEHSSTKKNPRKRTVNINKWKKTIAKTKRLRGLSYVSVTKKKAEIRARELKPVCQESCRKKCRDQLTDENRRTLFTQFWKNTDSWDQRRQYIANNIEVSLKKYMKTTSTIENDRRKFTHNYTIPMKTGNITVCKTMFLNTFDISEKFVRTCLAKTLDSGLITPDQRGHHIPANKTPEHIIESVMNHISSYPSYQSHYNRENTNRKFLGPELNICTMYKQYVELMKDQNKKEEDIAKSWLYREIFNTKFNLSFKLLEMDTCDDCDRFQRKILDTKCEEEKETVVAMKNRHLEEAERRYSFKKADKEECYKNNNIRVLFLDLQKCLPTPYLTNTQSFYLRKLWTLNLTIYEASEKKSSNYVWPESTAGRGGNEIASCLLKWAEKNLTNETITETITWTDNCQGQNRNMMLVLTYLWIMEKYPHVKTMSHKFLLKGHTHMEVDHVHSIIERKKKTLNTMEIAVPRDWAQFLRSCSGKNVFQVSEMTIDDFKEVTSLTKKVSGPFVLRKKNTNGDDFKISETVIWKFDRNKPGTLSYKTAFTQVNYNEVDLVRKVGKSFKCPESLPNVRETEKPISTSKYKDLMTLLQWIPKDFHDYYKNLKHSDNASDLPEI